MNFVAPIFWLDAVYQGALGGQLSGEALGKLLPVGNQGGFRAAGKRGIEKLVALVFQWRRPRLARCS